SEDQLAATTEAVETLTDDDLHAVAAKDDAWQHASDTARHSRLARLENLYIGAFLLPKTADTATQLPSSRHLWAVAHNQHEPTLADAEMAAQQARDEANVLHWWVAFPQIADQGGFDVLLGNPPWERIKLQEQEFFAARDPHVALAPNKAERGRRIELLREGRLQQTMDGESNSGEPPSEPEQKLYEEFGQAKHTAEAASLFVHTEHGRYPLTGTGDVN